MNTTTPIDATRLINASPIGAFQWRVVALCALVALLDGFDVQVMALVTPTIREEWGLPVSAFGTILSASFAGILLGATIGGLLGDRLGRRRILIAAFLFVGLTSWLTALSTSATHLIACRLLTGFGIGACMPNFTALTVEYVPAHRQALSVTLVFSSIPLGGIIAAFVAGDIIDQYGWRMLFVLGGVLPIMIALLLIAALPESIRFLVHRGGNTRKVGEILGRIDPRYRHDPAREVCMEESRTKATPAALFREGRSGVTVVLWSVFFFSLFGLYLMTSWLPTVFRLHGWPLEAALNSISLFFTGGIIGGLAVGWLIDRYGALRVLAVTYLSGAVFTAGIGLAQESMVATMVLITCSGLTIVGGQTGTTALAAKTYPTSIRSTGVGWGLGVGRVGAVISPWLGGLAVGAAWSHSTLFASAAAPPLLCAALILFLRGGRSTRPPA